MKKIIYSLLATLMMACAAECSAQTVSGSKDGHDYVDLGLPSGRLWATCNVGASKPTEYGDYFAWGETTPKKDYTWETYKWCKGSKNSMTKYCIDSNFGKVDNLTTLLAEDDAATANWGNSWRIPTKAEQQELIKGCDWEWTDNFNDSGIAGRVGTSKINGNTIFLPATDKRSPIDFDDTSKFGYYWSSTLGEYMSAHACFLIFQPQFIGRNDYLRYFGRSVRAVVK